MVMLLVPWDVILSGEIQPETIGLFHVVCGALRFVTVSQKSAVVSYAEPLQSSSHICNAVA
jgi:hypothetical protein